MRHNPTVPVVIVPPTVNIHAPPWIVPATLNERLPVDDHTIYPQVQIDLNAFPLPVDVFYFDFPNFLHQWNIDPEFDNELINFLDILDTRMTSFLTNDLGNLPTCTQQGIARCMDQTLCP